ncbi:MULTISPECIES: DUF1778 domain-containing protein [Streptacidiphilus]|uniref:DUF1778 domain-containing protein n=1 Tax=Streptacidiphilus cavernicola TaxID=3342716 RepID=A0ABV6UW36_9ACTN|nr:DUF1778 domain-containing protein [Streptacidiphilus jeojiense]
MADDKGSKALNLRFKDAQQHQAITHAARAAGVSVQDYILEAALRRALAVQDRFVQAALDAHRITADAFADLDPQDSRPDTELRSREHAASRSLHTDADHRRGSAA